MPESPHARLSRRERQIMDVLYANGKATAAEVRERMAGSPGYSAVRAMLRILEEKGQVTHEQDGLRYVYRPALPASRAKRSALRHMVDTFFSGSPEKAVAALLNDSKLTTEELDRLSKLVEDARRKGDPS